MFWCFGDCCIGIVAEISRARLSRGSVALITADLRDERIRRRNRLSDPPAFQLEHFGAILMPFCLQIFAVDCSAATTNVFNSFLLADVALWHCAAGLLFPVSPKLFRGCSLSMHWSTCFELFQATTAQLPVSSFNCPKAFWDGLHVRSVATARFFDTMKRISKRFCPNLPRWQKSANACPRLYLLPAIKR